MFFISMIAAMVLYKLRSLTTVSTNRLHEIMLITWPSKYSSSLLLDDLLLLLLVGGRQAELALPLVVHHLFHQPAGLPVKVGQLGWLGVDLSGADLRVSSHQPAPPLHLVDLTKQRACFKAMSMTGGCVFCSKFFKYNKVIYSNWKYFQIYSFRSYLQLIFLLSN